MKNYKPLIFLVASVVLGLISALIFVSVINGRSQLETPLLKTFGVHKPYAIGFLPYWLLNKAEPASLQKLNRITYFGLVVNPDGTLQEKSNPQEAEPGWHQLETGNFTDKIKNVTKNSADYSLLIHQANEASISALLQDPKGHAVTLVNSVEPLMKEHGFTDLNLDIESFRTATPEAQARMTDFLREVKTQMTEKKLGTLTTELTVASLVNDALMKPAEVGEISDYVVLMAYDFRYTGSYLAGAVAPIGGTGEKIEYDVAKSIELATNIIPPEKIILGIPLYGYEWETMSYDPESPVIPGTGKTATASRMEEVLNTCTECIKGRDELTGSPYVYLPPNEDSAIQQIYYEDQESLQKKLELAKQHKLGGVAFWAIGYESNDLLNPVRKYLIEY